MPHHLKRNRWGKGGIFISQRKIETKGSERVTGSELRWKRHDMIPGVETEAKAGP